MFEAFSEPAGRVIFYAHFEARLLRFDTIRPEHILLGYIDEDQNDSRLRIGEALLGFDSSQLLRTEGVEKEKPFLSAATAETLRERFSEAGQLVEIPAKTVEMQVSKQTGWLLNAAFQHAKGSKVSPLHLLWALLADEDGPVSPTLIENGVTQKMVEDAIRDGGASNSRTSGQ